MTNVFQAILMVIVTITIANGLSVIKERKNPTLEDNNFRFPSTHFVPSNLKIAEVVYDNLLSHLAEKISIENVNVKADGYFPRGKITCCFMMDFVCTIHFIRR